MAQGTSRGPCLGSNVKFFWKRFLYVMILIKIQTKISIYIYYSFRLLFLFFHIYAMSSSKKLEKEEWSKAGYLPVCKKKLAF